MYTEVRTRFAPSPTGLLHIGGVRTNFFAWLLARHHGGKFLLRIEDTDRERLMPGAVEAIISDLEWLGLDIDEGPSLTELSDAGYVWPQAKGIGGAYGPYIQSLKRNRYAEIAEKLVATGFAYRCDCSSERLEKERQDQINRKIPPGYSGYCRERAVPEDKPHVIRLKVPLNRTITLNDVVKGPVVWEEAALRDSVILKSDKFPTYHLASVVDDHEMKITHVLRGDEWLATSPLHILIYEALGWEKPLFAHLPPVLGADGRKLSKRHGAADIKSFRDAGYLPEALLNYILLLGWSPGSGDTQEIFSREEMIRSFTLERVNNAGAIFSNEKLLWMNGQYIRALPLAEYAKRIRPFLDKAELNSELKIDEKKLASILPHSQERIALLTEIVPLIDFLFKEVEPDLNSIPSKGLDRPKAVEILQTASLALKALSNFDHPTIEQTLKNLVSQFDVKTGTVFELLRIAVTGKKGTPPLIDSFIALGQSDCVVRLDHTAKLLAG